MNKILVYPSVVLNKEKTTDIPLTHMNYLRHLLYTTSIGYCIRRRRRKRVPCSILSDKIHVRDGIARNHSNVPSVVELLERQYRVKHVMNSLTKSYTDCLTTGQGYAMPAFITTKFWQRKTNQDC